MIKSHTHTTAYDGRQEKFRTQWQLKFSTAFTQAFISSQQYNANSRLQYTVSRVKHFEELVRERMNHRWRAFSGFYLQDTHIHTSQSGHANNKCESGGVLWIFLCGAFRRFDLTAPYFQKMARWSYGECYEIVASMPVRREAVFSGQD